MKLITLILFVLFAMFAMIGEAVAQLKSDSVAVKLVTIAMESSSSDSLVIDRGSGAQDSDIYLTGNNTGILSPNGTNYFRRSEMTVTHGVTRYVTVKANTGKYTGGVLLCSLIV